MVLREKCHGTFFLVPLVFSFCLDGGVMRFPGAVGASGGWLRSLRVPRLPCGVGLESVSVLPVRSFGGGGWVDAFGSFWRACRPVGLRYGLSGWPSCLFPLSFGTKKSLPEGRLCLFGIVWLIC